MIDSFRAQYRFLSNFFPVWVELDGEQYPTVEHAYQAAKTLDTDKRKLIQRAKNPGEAKRLGQRVALRLDWEDIKIGQMEALLQQKFSDESLKKRLVRTRPHQLVEGNTWGDRFWGVCRGEGQNWLGKILMMIREEQE